LQTAIGTCPGITDRNPIFDIPPGETREIRARVAVPPSSDASLIVSCVATYPTDGFDNGVETKGVVAQQGTIPATYAGSVQLTLKGAIGHGGPGNLFEATASTPATQPPP
jgi:hypothetical protein